MTSPPTTISRRAFAGGAVALLAGGRALAEPAPTAESPFGPFYPVVQPTDADADLTRVAGRSGRAKGQIIDVVGRVLDRFGRPIEGARLELWQANAAGRYDHANDPATAPLDPDFQGYASLVTGADGGWKITTVKPAAYDSPIGVRTPHIHFDVRGRTPACRRKCISPTKPGSTPRTRCSATSRQTRRHRSPRSSPIIAIAGTWC